MLGKLSPGPPPTYLRRKPGCSETYGRNGKVRYYTKNMCIEKKVKFHKIKTGRAKMRTKFNKRFAANCRVIRELNPQFKRVQYELDNIF